MYFSRLAACALGARAGRERKRFDQKERSTINHKMTVMTIPAQMVPFTVFNGFMVPRAMVNFSTGAVGTLSCSPQATGSAHPIQDMCRAAAMKNSMGMDSMVLVREASRAVRARPASPSGA